MAKVAVQLTNFTGGELSPRLDGRNDLAKYTSGCKTLQNMAVYPHGSAVRRPGTSFIAEVKNSAEKTRLIPFEFSTEQTYMLEFGNQYIRFYKDGGAVIEDPKNITGITQANPGVLTGDFATNTFPVTASTSTYVSSTTAASLHSVTMPTGIVTGNLIIMIFRIPSTTAVTTTPSGWTLLGSKNATGITSIFYKISDGTESTSVDVTLTTAASLATAVCYRITGFTGVPELAFEATSINDPPVITTSWSVARNKFISVLTNRRSDSTVTVAPTNYSNLISVAQASTTSTARVRVSTAERDYESITDNPAAFTTTGTIDNPHSATIVIKGILPTESINDGDTVVVSGVVGMTEVNGKRFKVSNSTSNTFELKDTDGNNVNTSSYSTYVSGGVFNRVYEISTPYLTNDLFEIKTAQSADVVYICHPNYKTKKLSRTGHTSWTLEDIAFTNGPFLDHNTTDTKLTASAIKGNGITITASSIEGINDNVGFLASDVGRFIHLGFHIGHARITSINSTTQVVADVIEPLATTDPSELSKDTEAGATTIEASTIKNFPDTGTIVINDEEITYTGKQTSAPLAFTGCTRGANGTTAVKHYQFDKIFNKAIEATDDFALGAFGETTGYPSCVTFFEQRLVFAGTNTQPQTLWFSRSGDYENMSENYHGEIADDDAIVYTIASNQVNAIKFLSSSRSLIVGTTGGEFAVTGGGTDDAITPTNILIKKQSNNGVADVNALQVGNVTLFLQRAKRKIRELAYNFDVDGYVAPDLTILAEHVTESGINQMSYMQEPNQIVWCVREDGQLVGMTYQREQQVVAWHRHIFGGVFGTGNAVCESVATIPTDDKEYQTWVIVKRTVNGVTRRYIEYINEFDFDENDNTSFNFLDSQLGYVGETTTLNTTINTTASSIILTSATSFPSSGSIKIDDEIITYTGKSTNTLTGCSRGTNGTVAASHTSGVTVYRLVSLISGLNHLEGHIVDVLADGTVHPSRTVSAGAISLNAPYNSVKVGLPYTSILQTMRLDAGSQDGTSQGKIKRVFDITVRLFETVGVEIGPDLDHMETIPFRSSSVPMNEPVPVFTGDKELEFRGDYETEGFIYLRQTQPLPLTILSLYPRLITNDA
jgi:hypothetical protein